MTITRTQHIVVDPAAQHIIVNPATQHVSVVRAGPQGPPGVDGGAAASYNHTQVAASTSWVINHDLGFYPNVTAFDEIGRVIEAAEIHHSDIQLELQLLTPRAGTARLS